MNILWKLGIAVSNIITGVFLIATFLMVADELRGVDLFYCNLVGVAMCKYPYPVIGALNIWDAWALDFGVIVAGIVVLSVGMLFLGMVVSELRGVKA